MEQYEADIDWCAARATMDLVAGKWAVSVLGALAAGSLRHNQLLRGIEGDISDRALIRTLRALEASGLVGRRVRTEVSPPAVSYHLTRRGTTLLKPLGEFAHWWRAHA